MLRNLLCADFCRSCTGGANGEVFDHGSLIYDAWQEEMAELGGVPPSPQAIGITGGQVDQAERSGGGRCDFDSSYWCSSSARRQPTESARFPAPIPYDASRNAHMYSTPNAGLMGRDIARSSWADFKSIPVLPPNTSHENRPDEFVSFNAVAVTESGCTTSASSGMPGEASPNQANISKVTDTNGARSCIDRYGAVPDIFATSDDDDGLYPMQRHGRCGFVVRLRPGTPDGPWMCHHFTLDGVHCVLAGLPACYANRCAGVLHDIDGNANPFDRLRVPSRCMGLRRPLNDHGYPTLVRCGKPARSPACRLDTCPYLADGVECPYEAMAAVAEVERAVSGEASRREPDEDEEG